MMRTRHARRGAALILALIVLAALLLLGLPFLFSQSSAMTGTRSYAHHVAATTARDGAEAIAVAAAANAVVPHWAAGSASPTEHTDLYGTLVQTAPALGQDDPLGANRVADRIPLAFGAGTALKLNPNLPNEPTVGTAISDESGKLDVNALSPRGWDLLLKAAQIQDWDDGAHANTRGGTFNSVTNQWVSGNDGDDIGELATALANLRFTDKIPEHRITQLEQLLLADPGHNKDPIPPGTPSTNQAGKSYGFRKPLSRTELERLRPYVTVHNLGQARGGVLDLGTVAFLDDTPLPSNRNNQPVIDSQPQAWDAADGAQRSMVVQGTMLITGVQDPAPAPPGLHRGAVASGADLYTWDNRLVQPALVVAPNAALGIALPAEVNINAASTIVRSVYGNSNPPMSGMTSLPQLNAITVSTTGIPFTAWRYQSPGVPINGQAVFELPALGIASFGLVSIDSAAVFADAAQHQAAQRARRVVAQALPQEDVIERRWTRQTAFEHDLLARRGSRLVSWPKPTARESDAMPEDIEGGADVAVAPAPLPTVDDADVAPHLAGGALQLDWKRAFAGDTASFAKRQGAPLGDAGDPVNGAPTLTPEGVRLTNDHLAYDFSTGGNTPFLMPPAAAQAAEISPRHVSVWVRSKSDWTGMVPILEVRMPQANAGGPFDGTTTGAALIDPRSAGDTSFQNLWSLSYDATHQHLVLALANPAIEHPLDYGPVIGFDDTSAASAAIDEASITSSAVATGVLAPKRPFNRVEHRYYLPLKRDRWYLIQACFSNDRPGGQAIIVDGLVGSDVGLTHPGSGPVELTKPGDHITIPSAILAADVPAGSGSADATKRIDITLRPVLTASVFPGGLADMLPAHGFVRIDDEYLSYDSISGTTLKGCRRGRRQNTKSGDTNPASDFPTMPPHAAGALVMPGGYRLRGAGDVLLTGGSTLAAPVPNGVNGPVGRATQVLVWAQLDPSGYPPTLLPNQVKVAANTDIKLKATGDPADFPARGFVVIEGASGIKYAYYDGKSGNSLTSVQSWYTIPPVLARGLFPDAPTDTTDLLVATIGPPPTVALVSIEVTGDPTAATAYEQSSAISIPHLIQLYDAAGDGHIEWLTYTHTALKTAPSGTHGFFINSDAFYYDQMNPNPPGGGCTRGVERTAFPPVAGEPAWPVGARVIPVQAGGSVAGIALETGDVITLAPWNPAGRAYQVCVRYRPTDDFSAIARDAHNHYFALTEALPAPVDLSKVDVLCWPAWSGHDLSPFGAPWGAGNFIGNVPGSLPWTSPATTTLRPPDDRRVYLGSFDERVASPVPMAGPSAGVPPAMVVAKGTFDGWLDKPTAGRLPATQNDTVVALSAAVASTTAPPFDVQASSGVFASSSGYGLVSMGGEVFAYQKSANAAIATMIARGLLGSARAAHVVGEPILPLPLGPVGQLQQSLAANDAKKLAFTNAELLRAPAILLSETNPPAPDTACEVLVAPRMENGSPWGATAPWLRGMYNSTVGDVAGGGTWNTASTIAIGWYPRYASALPNAWNGGAYEPYYRCRSYAWATFPLRLYGVEAVSANLASAIALVEDGSIAAAPWFDVAVRGSGKAFDPFGAWTSWHPLSAATGAGANKGPATAAVAEAVAGGDGVELRVAWRYHNPTSGVLTEIAACGDRAPKLGPVRMQVDAPAAVIAVEDTR